jgi:hypothetical protein
VSVQELSIFIDELGSFKGFDPNAAYYGLTLLFHEQDKSIAEELARLEQSLKSTAYKPGVALHAAPMIRREDDWLHQTKDERRQQFAKLFTFIRHCPITYQSFVFRQREVLGGKQEPDSLKLLSKLSRNVSIFLQNNLAYFTKFAKIIAYYDNGQAEISRILTTVFSALLFDVDFRPASTSKYRLFQAADMICTLETLRLKQRDKTLTKSEQDFFYKPQELKKNYLVPLAKKRFI